MDPLRQQRLNEVAAIAVRLEAETGFPAAALVAQWATESQWGSKPAGHANYFGIKKAARHEKCCTVTTHEVVKGERVQQNLEFADYDSLEDSCRDYVWMIQNVDRYASGWAEYQRAHDVAALQTYIARAYATDPNYATLIRAIGAQTSVQSAIRAARENV